MPGKGGDDKGPALLSSRDAGLLEPPERPQGSPASSSVWREPSNEYSGLISLRMDWFDLLAVQGTLKNLLQLLPEESQGRGAWRAAVYGVAQSRTRLK